LNLIANSKNRPLVYSFVAPELSSEKCWCTFHFVRRS